MKIVFVGSAESGSGYYRTFLPFKELGKKHDTVLVSSIRNLDEVKEKHSPDIMILYFPSDEVTFQFVKNNKKICVYSLDDNFLAIPSSRGRTYERWKNKGKKALEIIKECRAVIVTTKYLAGVIREYNKNTKIVPNLVPKEYFDYPMEEPDVPTIGYAGGINHIEDVKLLTGPIRRLLSDEKYKNVNYEFVCCPPPFKHEAIKHTHGTVAAKWFQLFATKKWTVGVIPIITNEFNRCISNLKLLEYGSRKLPVIATNFGPYEDSPAVLVTNSASDWESAIKKLLNDKGLRNDIGEACRKYAENYILDCKVWEEALNE